jgi:hypothetical protein
MKYPPQANNTLKKLTFCLIAQEKLRLQHNEKGQDFRNGVIDTAAWTNYLSTFRRRNTMIAAELSNCKQELKLSTDFNVDLEDVE